MSTMFATTSVDHRRVPIVLVRQWPVLAGLMALLALGGALVGLTRPERYQATAQVRLAHPISESLAGTAPTMLTAARNAASETALLASNRIRSDLALADVPRRAVSVAPVEGSDIVQIMASAASPGRAAAIANTYAATYVRLRSADLQAAREAASSNLQDEIQQVQAQLDPVQQRIAALASLPTDQRDVLLRQLEPIQQELLRRQFDLEDRRLDLQVAGSVADAPAVVALAPVPAEPSTPGVAVYAAAGALLGLLGGLALAFARQGRWGLVRRVDDVHAAGAPAPVFVLGRSTGQADQLAATLVADAPGGGAVVLIGLDTAATALPAADLAQAVGRLGRRVVLVDADLGCAELSGEYAPHPECGLSTILVGGGTLASSLQPVPLLGASILPAGEPMPSGIESGAAERLRTLLGELRQHADLVVLAGPTLPHPDAAGLVANVGRVVLVARQGSTPIRALRAAVEQLAVMHVVLAGVVLSTTWKGVEPRDPSTHRVALLSGAE